MYIWLLVPCLPFGLVYLLWVKNKTQQHMKLKTSSAQNFSPGSQILCPAYVDHFPILYNSNQFEAGEVLKTAWNHCLTLAHVSWASVHHLWWSALGPSADLPQLQMFILYLFPCIPVCMRARTHAHFDNDNDNDNDNDHENDNDNVNDNEKWK